MADIEVNIYSNRKLYERNGRVSEKQAARYCAEAIWDAGHNAIVRYYKPVQDVVGVSTEALFENWASMINRGEVDVAKDANILLHDGNGDGYSFVGGKVSIAPARHIDEDRPWSSTGTDDQARNTHAVLHELGHCLGAQHDFDKGRYGKQHPGNAWNQGWWIWGSWHRTPNVAGDGAPNACGVMIPEQQYDSIVRHQLFSTCFTDHYLTPK